METHRHRRLADKVFLAFGQACDLEDLDVAAQLLRVLDQILCKPYLGQPDRRWLVMTTVAAHERLWLLKHKSDPRDVAG